MKLTELKDKLKSIVDRLDAGEITTDQAVIELNGLFPPAQARSAEEILMEMHTHLGDELGITIGSALSAMHAYAAQFRREVTDEEIDEHIYAVYSPELDDDKDREFVYTVRACRGAMRSMAKWLRSKMKGE